MLPHNTVRLIDVIYVTLRELISLAVVWKTPPAIVL